MVRQSGIRWEKCKEKRISVFRRMEESLHKNGRWIKNVKFDYIFSSPLERAYETACIIKGDRDIEIVKDERLIEVGFGLYEGTVVDERKGSFALFFDDPQNYVAEKGAESYESLLARTKAFIENVLFQLKKINQMQQF